MTIDWLLRDTAAPSDVAPLSEYLAGSAEGKLMLPFCAACQHPLDLDQLHCDECAHQVRVWQTVEPAGRVTVSIMMNRVDARYVKQEAAYPVIEVSLNSGHRIIVSTSTVSDAPIASGTEVRLEFVQVGTQYIPRIINTAVKG
ncbi:unannotated protein [freshwater metagenome]|uniref:Unannotated protein n=1 Tax=freshwater metagenome TaxID=449393 RepID=A0A6J6I2A3_9ZZZZ|nr:3-ketoacyl-CoA thiolase [Actinomycetota bacterium]MSZ41271.1 3-ketoacyl-CoA thiolase [Actinomycetota bacterium]